MADTKFTPADNGRSPSGRATHEPGLASRPGHSVSVPNAEWQHVLEDGSLDHEWVTEFGVTFCTHCEAPKPEAD
jgi:hypothetical protein